jgi:hypothetical protein
MTVPGVLRGLKSQTNLCVCRIREERKNPEKEMSIKVCREDR